MDWPEVIFLGVLQGLTEFLPVSSSGHLALLEHHFGVREPQTLFDLFLHLGTLAAVLYFFRNLVLTIAKACLVWAKARVLGQDVAAQDSAMARLALLVMLSTICTGVVGLALGDRMEAWSSEPAMTGALLVVNGLILFSSIVPRCVRYSLERFPWWSALLVGLVQGIAILRGISRSGSTIVAATWLGLTKEDAAKFSFLLFMPAVVGGVALESRKGFDGATVDLLHALAGGLVAGIVGFVALRFLMGILARGRLYWFGPYCIVLGGFALLLGS